VTCRTWVEEAAPRSDKCVHRSTRGVAGESSGARNARDDIYFYAESRRHQHFNLPQQVWIYLLATILVTPGMSAKLKTQATNLPAPLTRRRVHERETGTTSKQLSRLASQFCAECLRNARSQFGVMRRSTPRQIVQCRHLTTRVVSKELSRDVLVTQISPLKREAMMPAHGPRLINFQGAVDNEGAHERPLRRPRRSLPVAAVAKTRSSLPIGDADTGHRQPPLYPGRALRDLLSLNSHAAPYRRRGQPHAA
jgi:hypothetical protein